MREQTQQKKFYPLNWSADDWALSPNETRVLFHILRRASKEGFAWASERSMAKHLGMERKTIRKIIRGVLEQKCVVLIEPGKFAGRRTQNVYAIRHPEDWQGVYQPGSEGEKYWLETRANCDRKIFRRPPQAGHSSALTPGVTALSLPFERGRGNFTPDVGGNFDPTSGAILTRREGTSGAILPHRVSMSEISKEEPSSSSKAAAVATPPIFASAQGNGATAPKTGTGNQGPIGRPGKKTTAQGGATAPKDGGSDSLSLNGVKDPHPDAGGPLSRPRRPGPNKPKNWEAFVTYCQDSNWGWQFDEECVDWARDFWRKMDLLKDEKSGQWLDGADGEPINNWKRYTSGALTKERKQQVKDEREEEEED